MIYTYDLDFYFLFFLCRYAEKSGLVIENMGVSKPPCCMCNTVLSNRKLHNNFDSGDTISNTKKDIYTDVLFSQVFASEFGVFSGPGSEKCGE